MLAFDRGGTGSPLVLLHGTNSSRGIWIPILAQLTAHRDVLAIDLPGHGESPPTSLTPAGFEHDLSEAFDALGLRAPAVVGHSVGGWVALELAKQGRAGAVLALAPAGLWRKHSPWLTDLVLQANWHLGRLVPGVAERSLRSHLGRRVALSSISARPGDVPYDVAVATARAAATSDHFPAHFKQTRVLRFEGGLEISADVPVRIIWGDSDRVALARRSRFAEELPHHAEVETWSDCGHMVMWDRPEALVRAALFLARRP